VAITIDVNGTPISYPQAGDPNWADDATNFAIQTSSALGQLGLDTGTTVDIPGTLDVTGNTTLDANLSVTGNATITGNLTANGNSNLGNASGDTIAVTGILNVDSGVLYVDPTNNRIGINDTTPSQALDVTGNVAITGDETVGGTLNVTGATTLSSTLGVTGDVAINTNKFNITATSGNTAIAGTLDVAGNTTLTGRLLNSNGSESFPSLTFSSDTDNGFYYIGSNNFGIVAGGAKVSDISNFGTLNGILGVDYRNLLQTQIVTLGTVLTGTTTVPYDNTIPQITEGIQVLSLNITPKNNSSILEIQYQIIISAGSGMADRYTSSLYKVGSSNALITSTQYLAGLETGILSGLFRITSGGTSQQTFTIRAGCSTAGTVTINGVSGSQYYGGTFNSYMIIKEFY
jgi:hypothetical protein